jgi:UDP-N-acetylmuramate--alanine ligase
MFIWIFKQLDIPLSYSVGAKLSFGGLGSFDSKSEYFVYEADEYDRNFLAFQPTIAVITGIDYDHPDIYPTRENYYEAFREFISKSENVVAHPVDFKRIGLPLNSETVSADRITLAGVVNRINAQLVVETIHKITSEPVDRLIELINSFPGVSRRFEKISENIYSDYAHTPEKIKGAIQLTNEIAGDNVVVVYEGLHNTRQHFIKNELADVFLGAKKVIVVPSYRAREDESLEDLTPEKLCKLIKAPQDTVPAKLDEELKEAITKHVKNSDLVLCLTAGGGGSLDEWLRKQEF